MTPDQTTVQELLMWAMAITTLISLGTNVWTMFSGPSRKNAARLDTLSVTLTALDQRIAAVEANQRSLPSKAEMHALELGMSKLQGGLETMTEKLSSQNEILKRVEATGQRHEEHLLKRP